MENTLKNLVENKNLKFIFVGGKGGVGKTTTASSLSLLLAEKRGKTLIISTDPAHNLSDAFNQQFSHDPTLVEGTKNLFAIEIDPKKSVNSLSSTILENQNVLNESGINSSFIDEFVSSMPGIDEAVVFVNMLKMSKSMDMEVVVFDTAPTGHTLKLLSFPKTMEKALSKIITLKSKFQAALNMIGGGMDEKLDKMFEKIKILQEDTEKLKDVLQNSDVTTFLAVCIPEFLSLYETERLVQELTIQNIDISNIVVNQIVFFEEDKECKKCRARFSMQYKYIKQIFELYSDFSVCLMPLEDEEIRGIDKLKIYAKKLLEDKNLPKLK